jgi:hypothetical protein
VSEPVTSFTLSQIFVPEWRWVPEMEKARIIPRLVT